MYSYSAFGLCIHSEIRLPELLPSQGQPDLMIRFGDIKDLSHETINEKERVLGYIEGVGKFLICQGREITVYPLTDQDPSVVRPTIVGSAMAAVLRQRGLLVLHASCVNINGKGIAFMGNSGAGKSTLADAFHCQNYPVLTDDVMAVNTTAQQPMVLPAYPQFKLWQPTVDALGHKPEQLSPIFVGADKLRYRFEEGFQSTPLPLKRIYILAYGSEHSIKPVNPQMAFAALVRHTRETQILNAPEIVKAHVQQCAALFKEVTFFYLVRRPGLEELPKSLALVENHL
ncbi:MULTISPECIES: hypothetical protein [Moorena]|uniref:Serine kinase of the HPr protein, regulates carbohydrate metabolism n=1 Tax=Moorena producens 3L TaxID=489825 RepID=F4XY64_9CYAN|nr:MULTISPECIES: hypothetical protein [Moorena]EGJ30461.1 hypothetical protein LYNGBM3L_50210 [Moorena producens 3L]NEP31294.1 hypothetical protein [Moorena sp. SIO3B2]NEP65881.1 hypothetical protein [Moorena sp. SIO3A5]NEQ09380.1 hypothetical protein [Moorena sp. SIO4E2]NER87369.1 hypothetical protein [Moorena sp. SIO3A2]